MDKRNIYQRINAVRAAKRYLQKIKQVDGRYWVVTHDQVTDAVRDDMTEQGIVIEPHLVSSSTTSDTGLQTRDGSPVVRHEAIYDVVFVNADEPQDRATVRVVAHALDTGDKAPGKALSYACKMAMLKVFSIVTGEDEEERVESSAEVEHTIPAKTFEKFERRISALNGKDFEAKAKAVWEEILTECGKIKDRRSALRLKGMISAKLAELRKANNG